MQGISHEQRDGVVVKEVIAFVRGPSIEASLHTWDKGCSKPCKTTPSHILNGQLQSRVNLLKVSPKESNIRNRLGIH